MPGPLDFYEPVRTDPVIGGDARPAPSFGDAFSAGRTLAGSFRSDGARNRVADAYDPILDVLNEGRSIWRGANGRFDNPGKSERAYTPGYDANEKAIWDEIGRRRLRDPKFLAGIPATREAFRAEILAREKAERATASDMTQRAEGVRGTIASFAGGAFETMLDPINVATLPIGGGGKTVLQIAAREALVSGAIEALQQPMVAARSAELGEDYTARTAIENIGMAAVGGAVIGGGITAGVKAAGALKARADGRIPLDRKLANLLEAAEPNDAALLKKAIADGIFADVSDGELALIVREIGSDRLTPDMTAAVNVIERGAETEESSPFVPNVMGDMTHGARLATEIDRLLADTEAPPAAAHVSRNVSREPGPDAGRDAAMRFIMDDLEGGATPVTDSGGLTRFGVSQRANPDVDVAGLTRGQSEQIYRDRYWGPLALDRYAPDTALVAFDAAINHGPGFARRILSMGTADPAQMIALRRAEYARLIARDPGKYARYERGWENRLRRLEARLGRDGQPVTLRREIFEDEPAWRAAQDALDRAEGDRARSAYEARLARGDPDEGLDGWIDDGDGADVPWEPVEIPDADLPSVDRPSVNDRGAAAGAVGSAPAAEIVSLLPALRQLVADRRQSLDPAKLAKRLDVAEADARGALALLMSGERSGLVISGKGTIRRAMQRRGPVDAITFLGDRGGLADIEGHDLKRGRGLQRMVSGSGPLFRKGGASIDRAGERLWEAGYFGPPSTTPRATVDDVLQMLERSSHEKIYRAEDMVKVAERDWAMRDAEPEIMGAIDNALIGRELDFDDAERAWIVAQVLDHGDVARAIADAEIDQANRFLALALREVDDRDYDALEELLDDARESRQNDDRSEEGRGGRSLGARDARPRATRPEELAAGGEDAGWWQDPRLIDPALGARFDDPRGDAARLEADSLEHDVRMLLPDDADSGIAARDAQKAQLKAAAPLRNPAEQDGTMGLGLFDAADQPTFRLDEEGEARAIADILKDIERDQAEIDAVRACMAPPKGGDA